MAIKKIIYVTPGENDHIADIDPNGPGRHGDLTKDTQRQLANVICDVLRPEVGDAPALFKSSGYTDPSWETLGHLKFLLGKFNQHNWDKDTFSKADAWDIDTIRQQAGEANVVIFGTMRCDFETLIHTLKNTGYDITDKNIRRGSIYTLTVHLDDSKKTDFREFE